MLKPITMEDSKASSTVDETDRSDPIGDIGTVRSYECVFCKRGFTTAQALGGHMNIHRKDRVKKTNSIASNSTKSEPFNYGGFRPNQVTQSFPSHQLSMPSELHINYQTYLPSSTWSLGSTTSQDKYKDDQELFLHNPQLLNSFKENWHRNLSAQVEESQEKKAANGEEDELDLELRLGHDR